MSAEQARRRRLFFALWPDDAVSSALRRLARGLPKRGRSVPPANLHITLAFAGPVDNSTHACLAEHAARIEAEAFALRVTRLGYFPRSRTLWLGANTCPPALNALARRLNSALEHCGLKPDFGPYRPHITLARDAAPSADVEVAPLDWPVDSFCLAESHTRANGVQYEILRRFELRG